MSTETQEHAKIEQLQQASPDEIEVAAGRDREELQGWVPTMATDEEVRDALEKAFDYRGDITITRKDGSAVEGYVFDRKTASTLEQSCVRLFPKDSPDKLAIPYSDIAALSFTGKDRAAGASWEA